MKKKENLYIKILSVATLFGIMIMALWAVDIGCSGMLVGGVTVGLFEIRSPNVHYHLGLIIASVTFLILVALYLKEILLRR
jgi:hypothetical protein